MANDKPTKESMNCLNVNGYSPFLAFLEAFTTTGPGLIATIA